MLSRLAVGFVEEESDLDHVFAPLGYIFQKNLDKDLVR
jgi:hypothetical protein